MKCDLRCGLRMLLEHQVLLSQLVSLDVLRLRITPERLIELHNDLLNSPKNKEQILKHEMQEDPFAACVADLASAGTMPLYVADISKTCAYRIQLEVIQSGCCCWSVIEAASYGRFLTKTALMRHKSPEVRLDGQPIYVSVADVDKLFRLRPTSKKRSGEIVKEVIDRNIAESVILTNAEVREEVRRHPEIRRVSDRAIDELAARYKPESWKRPGPRARIK